MRISEMFSKPGARPAFMPYVCCGDPSVVFTVRLVETLVANGADAIEFGIPFSDPIADGKTIQGASSRALANEMTPQKAIDAISLLRKKGIRVPITAMTYYNIVFANGTGNFLKKLRDAGADGLIVPDVPLEESGPLREKCAEAGIDLICMITPNCTDERIKRISEKSQGFLYAVSVLGITGARGEVAPEAVEFVKRAKRIASIPIAVGFGISQPAHAAEFAKAGADAIIVGSGLVEVYAKHMKDGKFDEEKALGEVAEFAKAMVSSRLPGKT
ncbi:Tryptophan synthase alpha chain [uncultured archaeon]|nr:Tryptophan synthase alpha chain [uncultured archaeon]